MIIFKTIPKVVRNCAKVSITLSLIIAFFAISFIATNATAADPMKARLSYHWYPKHTSAIFSKNFVEEVEKETDVEIDIYDSGQLYGIREALSAVSSGSVEMAGVLDLILGRSVDEFSLSMLPFFWDSMESWQAFFKDTPEGRKVWSDTEEKLNIKILASVPTGPSMIWSTKPITSIEDLDGRKSRYLSAVSKPAYTELGLDVVSVTTGEMYTALKQGMIDTCSTVPSAMKAYSWDDFLEYGMQPWLYYVDAWVIANGDWWESLPEETRKKIEEDIVPRLSEKSLVGVMEEADKILKEFEEEGGTVYHLSDTELKETREKYEETAWPKIAKDIDPDVYKAAKEFMGYD